MARYSDWVVSGKAPAYVFYLLSVVIVTFSIKLVQALRLSLTRY